MVNLLNPSSSQRLAVIKDSSKKLTISLLNGIKETNNLITQQNPTKEKSIASVQLNSLNIGPLTSNSLVVSFN